MFSKLTEAQKQFFETGRTRDLAFRICQLQLLADAMRKNETVLEEALKKDLGKSAFESYATEIGFVLAAAGSAVGLGNLWRFPYLAAKYGGGTFLLVYLILAVTFGFSLMIAEIAIGRKTGLSAIGAFKKLDKRFGFLGVLAAIIPIIIFPYYSVIGGWVIKYFVTFVTGNVQAAADDAYFNNFIGTTGEPIGWFCLFIAFTSIIVLLGVEKGIETVSKFMMPVLVVLTVIIAGYGLTVDGAIDGLIYYVKPSMENFSGMTVIAAMGQLFYSMSLAMGIMITYGSYMKKDNNLESSVRQIEVFDTGIAFFSGLMIIPAIFAISPGGSTEFGQGSTLMFTTMPQVFAGMPGGQVVGAVFFVLVFLAAITSSIGLMEAIVAAIQDKFGWKRIPVCIGILLFSIALGICSSLGFGIWDGVQIFGKSILDSFDFLTNNILMPIVALCTCIFIGFFLKPKSIIDEVQETAPFRLKGLYVVFTKWLAPVCIVIILVTAFLQAAGILVI